MKIAFVNQPFDTILPPNQNSVGGCTYGLAQALSRTCGIFIYGMTDSQKTLVPGPEDAQLKCRFIESRPWDRLVFQAMQKYRRVATHATLLSASSHLYPDYGQQVARALQNECVDVIHVQHSTQYLPILRSFNPRARIVLQMHAEWFSQSPSSAFLDRVSHADLITGVSHYVTEKTQRSFPAIADRCRVFSNGIHPEEFPTEKDYALARSTQTKRILYAGAVSPHRGLHLLMQAFNRVIERYPDVHLDIVGPHITYPLFEIIDRNDKAMLAALEPYYSSEALSLVRRRLLGSTRAPDYAGRLMAMLEPAAAQKVSFRGFAGNRDILLQYFRAADLFVFPSLCNDSFGIPVVEAMASGVPVVASRSGGVVEIVQDGITGTIVEKNDAEALADSLLMYLSDDRARETAGRAARERAMTVYTWETVAEQILAEYRRICSPAFELSEAPRKSPAFKWAQS